jgi:hypothetical protein
MQGTNCQVSHGRPSPHLFSDLFILGGFKSNVLQLFITKGLQARFSELFILQELRVPWAGVGPAGGDGRARRSADLKRTAHVSIVVTTCQGFTEAF